MRKTKALEVLDEYFKTKGRILNAQEYSRETDTPIRFQVVKILFGSWNRMEKQIMAARTTNPEDVTDVEQVIASRAKALADVEASWKEASENQDAKALREAQAHVVAETLARNAATAQGANANKIAIGGPLPGEQPKLEALGATVNIDPVTQERTVVDTKPKIVSVELENPKTPIELRAFVANGGGETKEGDVETGDATDGGSQGSASVATAGALAGVDSVAKPVADEKSAKTAEAAKASDSKTK